MINEDNNAKINHGKLRTLFLKYKMYKLKKKIMKLFIKPK